jgi:hypothetical protein
MTQTHEAVYLHSISDGGVSAKSQKPHHGSSVAEEMIEAIIQAGGHPSYTEYPKEGHDLWAAGKVYSPSADQAFFTWLFSQKKL